MTVRAVLAQNKGFAYVNDVQILNYSGIPGGNFGSGTGIGPPVASASRITNVDMGFLDGISPNATPSSSIGKSSFINHIDLSWPVGTDDVNGTGV